MEVVVVNAKSGQELARLGDLSPSATILDVKKAFHKHGKKTAPSRQSFKLEAKGKMLKDEETLKALNLPPGGKLYFKDLGPQVGWKTVFLVEYAGPLAIYMSIYWWQPRFLYGAAHADPRFPVTHLAAACWTLHYSKRLLETVFVHRFSNATMPLANIFKNCGYYWGFAAFIAYYINHPLYTNPAYKLQINLGCLGFLVNELGNLSVHVALRNLRSAGSKERKIPVATGNPFTWLFTLVSCPNYTYEVGAWTCFTLMTQCGAAGLFAAAGLYQMSVWALGKHRNYRREFPTYPRRRKAILPFLL